MTYENGMEDESISYKLSLQSDHVDWLRHQLTEFHPRDDYRVLLQLSHIFLRAGTADMQIHAPGAYQRARSMAKLITSFKVDIFRSQFRLTARDLSSLQDVYIFVVRI